jgi:pimeloyl-ACP methyl ester carboxylesterase
MRNLRALAILLLGAACVASMASCATPREATIPLRTVAIGPAEKHDTLVVLLPGIRDVPEDFARSGFADHSGAFDLLAVDAHWGYYERQSIVDRLHDDIVEPARRGGYMRIWLVGISLGGFGALLYVDRYPDDIEGVVLLAPYLGEPQLASDIEQAGGLEAWSKMALPKDPFALGWRALQSIEARGRPNVIVGYGTADPLVATYGPLLKTVPTQQVHTRDGGHRWSTWAPLWRTIEAAGAIPNAHSAGSG